MLEKISTKELVEELKEREGVKTEYAEPHQDKKLSVNGPAVILIIIDCMGDNVMDNLGVVHLIQTESQF